MSDKYTNNLEQSRFELEVGGHIAIANYRVENKTLFIDYVEAPQELRGTGAAGRLMQHVVDHAKEKELTIEPICGYAKQWLIRKGHYKDNSSEGPSCPISRP